MKPASTFGSRTDLLLRPGFLVSLLLLIVNDRFLKLWWPGLVTGKLSDFAGPFVVAVVTGVILGRRNLAIGMTAAGFAALQLSPTVADLATPVFGGTTHPDPTDLVGLLVLVPAHRLLRALQPATELSSAAPIHQPDSGSQNKADVGHGFLFLARRILLIPVAVITVFSITSSSCLEADRVEDLIVLDDGSIEASLGYGVKPFRSDDGGLTWTRADEANDGDPESEPPETRQTEGCLDDGRCFRTILGERVEQRTDGGSWATAYEFTEEDYRRIALRADSCSGHGGSRDELFGSLAITPISTDNDSTGSAQSQTVVVSMSDQGVLVFDSSSEKWSRHAVGWIEPISLLGPSWLPRLYITPLLAIGLSPMLFVVAKMRGGTLKRSLTAAAIGSVLSAGAGLIVLALFIVTLGGIDYAWAASVAAFGSIAAFGIALAVALASSRHPTA